MYLGVKILLSVVAVVLLIGVAFYLWMWLAWTPKRTAPEVTHIYKTNTTLTIPLGEDFYLPEAVLVVEGHIKKHP